MTGGVTFHSSEQQLTKLLGGVESGAIQLPDFQRDWVWDDEHIRGLLASVSMSYPIGTLMLLDAGNEDVRFASRPVQGTMNANRAAPHPDGHVVAGSGGRALSVNATPPTFSARKTSVVSRSRRAADPHPDTCRLAPWNQLKPHS